MDIQNTLGKLEKIPLRGIWTNEAHDFTKWLAKEENLAKLSDAIEMELELVETESSVGPFSVDIYANEAGGTKKIIIENQLEPTDHDHLGKLITYAAGKGAAVVVWIVSQAREEHRQAIEWLNGHTDVDSSFFLIEVELWSIDGSNPAVRFNVVEKPNEWGKTMKRFDSLNDTQKLALDYWQRYRELALANPEFMKRMRPQTPQAFNWTNIHCGSSSYVLELSHSTQKKEIRVGIYVRGNKDLGRTFIDNASFFEEKLGYQATPFSATKDSGLRFCRNNCPIKNKQDAWDEYIEWQIENVIKLFDAIKEFEDN